MGFLLSLLPLTSTSSLSNKLFVSFAPIVVYSLSSELIRSKFPCAAPNTSHLVIGGISSGEHIVILRVSILSLTNTPVFCKLQRSYPLEGARSVPSLFDTSLISTFVSTESERLIIFVDQ